MNNRLILIALFLALGSSNPVAIKFALNAGWPPFLLGFLRMTFIGLFFTCWVVSRREGLAGPGGDASRFALAAAGCKTIGVITFYASLWLIPANRAVIISTLSPMATLLLLRAIHREETVRREHLLGTGITIVGITLLLGMRGGGSFELPTTLLAGDLIMIVSVIFNSAMTIYERKALLRGASPGQLLVSTNLFSAAAFACLFCLSEESLQQIPVTTGGIGAYLYLISAVGVILFYYRRWLISQMEVAYINSFSHLGKALSVLYAVLILGERIAPSSILCFALILFGTLVATRRRLQLSPA